MSWIKCTEAMPPAGSTVKMKWVDGETEWNGDPVLELRDVRIGKYGSLLWWRESPSLPSESGLREQIETMEEMYSDQCCLTVILLKAIDKIISASGDNALEIATKAKESYDDILHMK